MKKKILIELYIYAIITIICLTLLVIDKDKPNHEPMKIKSDINVNVDKQGGNMP